MGTSTDAILAFGFDLGEELPEKWRTTDDEDESFDFYDWARAYVGFPEWSEDRPSGYFKERDAAIAAGVPVELVPHCSYDCPMHFLALRGTDVTASRGYPKAVALPEITAEQIANMRAFCEEQGIEWQEPKWHIFSMWG